MVDYRPSNVDQIQLFTRCSQFTFRKLQRTFRKQFLYVSKYIHVVKNSPQIWTNSRMALLVGSLVFYKTDLWFSATTLQKNFFHGSELTISQILSPQSILKELIHYLWKLWSTFGKDQVNPVEFCQDVLSENRVWKRLPSPKWNHHTKCVSPLKTGREAPPKRLSYHVESNINTRNTSSSWEIVLIHINPIWRRMIS